MMTDHSFDPDDLTSNPRIAQGATTMGQIVEARLSRRGFLGGVGAVSTLALTGCSNSASDASDRASTVAADSQGFTFAEITRGQDEFHHLPEGYEADLVIRWGDPRFPHAEAFDPLAQTAEKQAQQFGYNNDFIGYHPLTPEAGQKARGLLCVNHEYTSTQLLFPGLAEAKWRLTADQCAVEMEAHGGTVLELAQGEDLQWAPVVASQYNRRLTATPPMTLTGPAAGSPRLQTSDDPTGAAVLGTLNNCAGGMTPWGTYLMAEENFNSNFLGEVSEDHPEAENH